MSISLCICNPLPFILSPLLFPYIQLSGSTILMLISEKGHIEAIKILLTASDLNVNQADVSLYLLTPSPLVVGGRCEAHLPHLIPHSNPRNDDLSSPNA